MLSATVKNRKDSHDLIICKKTLSMQDAMQNPLELQAKIVGNAYVCTCAHLYKVGCKFHHTLHRAVICTREESLGQSSGDIFNHISLTWEKGEGDINALALLHSDLNILPFLTNLCSFLFVIL